MPRTRARQNLMLEQKHGEEHPKQEHDKKHNKECLEQELDISLPTTTTKKTQKQKTQTHKAKDIPCRGQSNLPCYIIDKP
jgi:hypothetical protein